MINVFLSLCVSFSQVFVVELLAALAVRVYALTSYYQLYSITNTMGVFKKKVCELFYQLLHVKDFLV